jgi:glycosyltransferase involved in cell wall biosynthesis
VRHGDRHNAKVGNLRLVGCMITTNNMPYVKLALRSVIPHVDEMLVVDGGSSDGTVELAKALGCRVVINPWPGSNSAQRQHYVDLLNEDAIADPGVRWALIVDSDEILSGSFSRQTLLEWEQARIDNAWVGRKWLVKRDERIAFVSSSPHTPDWQRRVIRITADVSYSGGIHERCEGLKRSTYLGEDDMTVLHLDFLLNGREARQAKVERYESTYPKQGYPWYYLYEDFGYRLQSCEDELAATGYLEAVEAIALTEDTGSLILARLRYWLSRRGFFQHVFKPAGARVKRIYRRLLRRSGNEATSHPKRTNITRTVDRVSSN